MFIWIARHHEQGAGRFQERYRSGTPLGGAGLHHNAARAIGGGLASLQRGGIRGNVRFVVPGVDLESLSLPPGYRVADDAYVLALVRGDGSVVSHFMEDYADQRLIESVAWEDYRGR